VKLEKKTLIELAVALLVIVVIAGLAFAGYKYYLDNDDTTEDGGVEVAANCEELKLITPEKASAPTVPVLELKLNKNSKTAKSICSWSINGEASHVSVPVKEKCIFGDKIFDKAGTYKIALEVSDNNRNLNKTVTLY
jgi:Tfp pilus assembly protein PilE